MPDFYRPLRSLLFRLDAERAHHLGLAGLRTAHRLHLDAPFRAVWNGVPVEAMGLTFPNPVGVAAGLDKEGKSCDALAALGFGFVEIGTITPRPQSGNPKPRLFRLVEHQAIINRMGFNNPGIDTGVKNVSAHKFNGILGFNIGKNKDTPNENAAEDYLACLRAAYPVADYIAVNLSSPNTPGLRDLQGESFARSLLSNLKSEQAKLASTHGKHVPLAVKFAPDLDPDQIRALGSVVADTGIEAVIATNTTLSRRGVENHPLASEPGGLSGKPLTDSATDVIRQLRSALPSHIPIIGVGGIMTGQDAADKIRAGASLVQVYTGFIYRGPQLLKEIFAALTLPKARP